MPISIGRRELIAALGGSAIAWPLVARAQQPAMPVVGLLAPGSHAEPGVKSVRLGLKDAGFVEGQNVVIEFGLAGTQFDPQSAMVGRLVELAQKGQNQ